VTIDRIVLHDRPNADDQILNATLSFSDGSSLATGMLPNAGGGLTLDFSPRAITSVTLTVTQVSVTTGSIGLAEIEVRRDLGPSGSFAVHTTTPSFIDSRTVTLDNSVTDSHGVTNMRFRNSGGSWDPWVAYSATKSWELAAGDGAKTVEGEFRDGAGNVLTATATITLDATDPTGGFTIGALDPDYVATSAVTLVSAVSDAHALQMRFSNDNSVWSDWESYAASKSWDLTSGDGLKTVYAQFRDAAGNVLSDSDQITVQGDLPQGSFALSGGATYATSTAVTLANTITGAAEMRFSNDNSIWSDWEPYAAQKAWTLSSGDGAKTVYAEFRSHTGSVYGPIETAIVLDGTAPTVADDAPAGWRRSAVTVHLAAADAGSGPAVTQYRVQGSGTWLAAAGDAFTVSGNVERTYEYRALDKAGNASATGTCAVRIDSAKPLPKAVAKASVKRGAKATLKYRVNDSWPKSGTATVTIKIKTMKGKTVKSVVLKKRPVNTAQSYTFKCSFQKGTYRFYVSAKDGAGNQ
jgi:hypothetical protein